MMPTLANQNVYAWHGHVSSNPPSRTCATTSATVVML